MPLAARIVPAKPGIPRRQDPRRRSKQEPAEPAMRRSDQVAQLTADVKTGAARMLRRHQLVEDQPKLRSLDPDKLKALRPHRRSPEDPQARQPPPPCEPRHPGRRHGGAKEERSCPPAQDGEGQQRQLVTCGRPRKSTKPKASHTLRPISARETSGCARIRDNFAMPCGEESALGIETGSSMRPTIAQRNQRVEREMCPMGRPGARVSGTQIYIGRSPCALRAALRFSARCALVDAGAMAVSQRIIALYVTYLPVAGKSLRSDRSGRRPCLKSAIPGARGIAFEDEP